jgi:hypothetical protein
VKPLSTAIAAAALALATITAVGGFGYDPRSPSSTSLQHPTPDAGMIGSPWVPGAKAKYPLGKSGLNVQLNGTGKIVGLDDRKRIIVMDGTCGGCGEAQAPEGNGLGGNNVAGTGMSLNDIARAIAYGAAGEADPRTIGNNGIDAPSIPTSDATNNAETAQVNAAGGSGDAKPVGGNGAHGGNCNCADG